MIVCRLRMETRMIPNYAVSIDKRDFVPYTQGNGTVPERDAALPLPHGAGTVAAHGNPSRLPTEAAFICRRDCGGGDSLSGESRRQGANMPSCKGRSGKGGTTMFSKTDFWIGLAVGAVAGIFGYRFMQERSQQLAALESGQAELSVAELQRQKEELEDLIAAQSALDK